MTYFDHVRCSACKAMIDPESVASRPGQGLSCPRCGAPLSLGDLFGLKDAFSEEEGEELSLDDAISTMKAPTASVHEPGQAPPPKARPAPAPQARAAPKASPAKPASPAPKQLTDRTAPAAPAGGARPLSGRPAPSAPAKPVAKPPVARGVAKGPAPTPKAEEPPAGGGSALDAMRALRKR